jgi:hypothetical protein
MRRALASLLLVLSAFPAIAPFLRADSALNLPACCRLNGKHHCAMPAAQESSSGPAVKAMQPKCCDYPAAIGVSGQWNVALAANWEAVRGSLPSQSVTLAPTEAPRRVLFSRSRQKRGPPTLS